MKSIFEINRLNKLKLKEMISFLFPEFRQVFIRRSGVVKFKKHWYSIFRKSIHVSELCITEFPKRLSEFRQGDHNYSPIYNMWLGQIISDMSGNAIDWYYCEFMKIRKDPRLENIIRRANALLLPEAKPNCETIGTIINCAKKVVDPILHISKSEMRRLNKIEKLYEALSKESIIDKLTRIKFLR